MKHDVPILKVRCAFIDRCTLAELFSDDLLSPSLPITLCTMEIVRENRVSRSECDSNSESRESREKRYGEEKAGQGRDIRRSFLLHEARRSEEVSAGRGPCRETRGRDERGDLIRRKEMASRTRSGT